VADNLVTLAESEWADAVARWQDAVADFDAALQEHWNNRQKAIDLGEFDAWQAQLDRALLIRAAVDDLADKLRSGSDWFRKTFGMGQLAALGFFPAVPLAVIIGSISAVAAITYTLYTYNRELTAKWEYLQSRPDATPAEVAQVLGTPSVFTSAGSALTSTISTAAFWILLAGLLFKFGPQLLKGTRK